MSKCITKILLDEKGETVVHLKNHYFEEYKCKKCGIYISQEWYQKKVVDRAFASVVIKEQLK